MPSLSVIVRFAESYSINTVVQRNFIQAATVNNELNSLETAVDITNTAATGSISFEALGILNGLGNPAINIVDNLGPINLGDVSVVSNGAIGLFASGNTDGLGTSPSKFIGRDFRCRQ